MTDPEPTADDGSIDDESTDFDAAETETDTSRRTYLKATGVLAALGLGGLASTDTTAAQTDHDHLGEVWQGDPGGVGFGVKVGPDTDKGLSGFVTGTSGATQGVRGRTDAPRGQGILGISTNSSGKTDGVQGRALSDQGRGVFGQALSDTGVTRGVFGKAESTRGRGVDGFATADSGNTVGVRGFSQSSDGNGVLGIGDVGVEGRSRTGDTGVLGRGNNDGVRGETSYSFGDGVRGIASSSSGAAYGVFGTSEASSGRGVRARASSSSGQTYGVDADASSDQGTGVYGEATSTSGETFGVRGVSDSTDGGAAGVDGQTGSGATSNFPDAAGVRGSTDISGQSGVKGITSATGSTSAGVYGEAINDDSSTYAVFSQGDSHVVGDFSATGTKSFVETVETGDGPKEVVYTAVEAGRVMTEATDVAQLQNGRAEIDLPTHFGQVTSTEDSLSVETTPYSVESSGLAVTERTVDRIVVEDLDGTGSYEFSFTVKGTRKGYEDKQVVRDAQDIGVETTGKGTTSVAADAERPPRPDRGEKEDN